MEDKRIIYILNSTFQSASQSIPLTQIGYSFGTRYQSSQLKLYLQLIAVLGRAFFSNENVFFCTDITQLRNSSSLQSEQLNSNK